MKSKLLLLFCLICFYICSGQTDAKQNSTFPAIDNFLTSLSPEQTKIAHLSFADSSRLKWSNLPMEETMRKGIQFKDLTDEQKIKVHRILRTVLSQQGYQKVLFIMQYDEELHQRMNTANNPLARKYGANNYFVTLFSYQPSANNFQQKLLTADSLKLKAFKFEGHHISINLSFSELGEVISCTPLFTGINPAQTITGLNAGKYVMADENELGKELFHSLSPELQKKATAEELPHEADVVMERGKRKMESGEYNSFAFDLKAGISYRDMNKVQQNLIKKIIKSWVENFNDEIADNRLKKILNMIDKNPDKTRFSWLGTSDVEKLHYYRLQTPDFIIEFTNRDQGIYHFHSLWRMTGDGSFK